MAWVLVRLKLRLLTNGLRGKGFRQIGFVVGAFYALALGTLAFAVLVSLRSRPADLAVVTEVGAVALVIGWATGPVLGFGSDETLDPTRLALLPLRRPELMTGLLAASLVGPAPVGTAIALAGAAVAFSSSSPAATAIVVVAAAVELPLCVGLSRALVTALSAALRSRRGRDLRFLLLAVLGLLPETLHLLLFARPQPADRSRSAAPLGPRPQLGTTGPARAGHGGRRRAATGRRRWPSLTGGALTLALVLVWWARALEVVMTTAERPPPRATAAAATTPSRSRVGRGGRVALPLFSPGLDVPAPQPGRGGGGAGAALHLAGATPAGATARRGPGAVPPSRRRAVRGRSPPAPHRVRRLAGGLRRR